MSPDEKFVVRLLSALAEVKLEALVVGAFGAVLHGAPLMTQDIDLLIRDTPLNRKKLEKLSAKLGTSRPALVSELSRTMTMLGAEQPVDFLFDQLPGGLSFAALRSRSVKVAVGKCQATVASLGDIISSKRAVGRKKDLAHLPVLEDTLAIVESLGKKKPE